MDCTRITFSALLLLAVARGYLVVNESLGEPRLIAAILMAATGYWLTIMSTSMVHALLENTTYQISDTTLPILDLIILLFAFTYYCFVRVTVVNGTLWGIPQSSVLHCFVPIDVVGLTFFLKKLFYSLITTINKLKTAQQWVKLKLYINLMLILILACILAFLCQLVELCVSTCLFYSSLDR